MAVRSFTLIAEFNDRITIIVTAEGYRMCKIKAFSRALVAAIALYSPQRSYPNP